MSAVRAEIGVSAGELRLDAVLDVAEGERVAIVGPNGAGKTTLLRALAGLVPIDEGSIHLAGVTVDDPGAGVFVRPQARRIGVVFQDYLLFPHLSATDNVAFPLRANGVATRVARDRARQALADFGLADIASARPATLSGGQAQRVALLRALVMDPAVVLLDEPMAALDAHVRPRVREAVREILDGRTVLLVTHDAGDVAALATRVIVLESGRIAQHGSVASVRADPATPFVAALFAGG